MTSFAIAVFLLTITPGPAVLTLAGVGAAFGWRRAIWFLIGLFIGVHLVCFAVVSGLAAMVLAHQLTRTVLLFSSSIYLCYLALRIAFVGKQVGFIKINKPGIMSGIILQLVNPKAYAVNTMLFSSFSFYSESFAIEILIKVIINNVIWIPLHLLWLYVGVRLNQIDLKAETQKTINFTMAGALIIVAMLSLWSMK